MESLDILGRNRVTVFDFLGEFGHFGSHEGHCLWESLDIFGRKKVTVLDLIGEVSNLGLRSVTVLEFIGVF